MYYYLFRINWMWSASQGGIQAVVTWSGRVFVEKDEDDDDHGVEERKIFVII